MKFLALALANDNERFIKGYPPKGANLLLLPNIEISQLANLISKRDELLYLDDRIDSINSEIPFDIALIFANFGQEKRAMELVLQLSEKGKRSILFGPLPAFWKSNLPDWVDTVVTGSILNAYPDIREDLSRGVLKKQYVADTHPAYIPQSRTIGEKNIFLNNRFQCLNAVLGCFCLPQLKSFCPQNLYYGNNVKKRSLIEVIGEVISLPYKPITLLDEDITQYPDYYHELFNNVWNYKKHWTVQASRRLFELPRLIRLLAKAGTRLVFLTEDWFPSMTPNIFTAERRRFREELRQVKMLHSERMMVGARLSLIYYPASEFDFNIAFKIIDRLDLDFLEIKLYQPAHLDNRKYGNEIEPSQRRYYPMLPQTDPAWLKNRFYALGHIVYRICKRPLTLGFYNTFIYLIPYSLAYRQNYLEGIAYPP
jgi:hypothetical protein